MLHFNGNQWTHNSLSSHNLNGLWGSESGNVYTVGDAGTILHRCLP